MQPLFEKFTFSAMNTQITILAAGNGTKPEFEFVQKLFNNAEQKFSRFLLSSELGKLNTSGVLTPATDEMLKILQSAMRYSVLTLGAFNPAILDTLIAAGYSKSFELLDSHPDRLPHDVSRVPRLAEVLEIDEATKSVRTTASIDLGGIVKGWVTDLASDRLRSSCEGWVIDAGGDIRAGGVAIDSDGWIIGVDDPATGLLSDVIRLQDGAVATSSSLKRTWLSGNTRQHHIIEPSTGRPSCSGVVAASIVANSTELAEVVAKSIVVSGETFGVDLLKQTETEGRLIRTDGSVFVSEGWPSIQTYTTDRPHCGEVA